MNGSLTLHRVESIIVKHCRGQEFTWIDLDISTEDRGLFILRVFPGGATGEIPIVEAPELAEADVAEVDE